MSISGSLVCPPSGMEYLEGDTLALVCSVDVSGCDIINPSFQDMDPTLTWYKDNGEVNGIIGPIHK